MKIALFGATGTIGRRIAQEALARGHELTAIVRDQARLDSRAPTVHPAAHGCGLLRQMDLGGAQR
jgi:uncharacterized protein